jgi:hypothetical protein
MLLRHLIVLIINARKSSSASCKTPPSSSGKNEGPHSRVVVLIGQIKLTRIHVLLLSLSQGVGSNKQQSISLRCRKIRHDQASPKGLAGAKLALFVATYVQDR